MLPEQEGYAKARKILRNSFGQSQDGESDKLLQLAMDME
jgi:hypothetical protein